MSWPSRKRRIIISLLFVFTIIAFVYVRRELFLKQARRLIEQNLEKSLPCQLSVGRIAPDLFYGLVLEDLEIGFPQISNFPLRIKVDQARLDYNFWEAYRKSSSGKFVLVLEGGQFSFGKDRVFPLLKNVRGRLLLKQNGLYFQDFRATFNNNLPQALKIYGELSQGQLSLTANLDHLEVKDLDILTNIVLTLDKKTDIQDKTPKLSGTLKTYGSVVNNQPVPELNSSFEIRDSKLRILTFSLGDNYDLRGIVSFASSYHADLSLNFHQALPSELISQFSKKPSFSGLLNGLIKISGDLKQPEVEGYLELENGYIGDLDFVSADINIKGRYPTISIVDSHVRREEDAFIMEGEIDFTKLEEQDLLDIRIKPDKAIFWQGWDITRSRENQVHMSKNVADDLKVTFDTFIEEEKFDFEDNYTNELGLEYKIFGDKMLKLRLKKDEGILGVERRLKF